MRKPLEVKAPGAAGTGKKPGACSLQETGNMSEDNRKDVKIVESIAASNPLRFRVWSPNLTAASSAYVAAFTAGAPSFFAGVGLAQWLVKVGEIPPEVIVAASMTVGFGTAVGVFVLVYFADLWIHTNKYKVDYPDGYDEEDEETATDALIGTARNNQRARLTPEMRPLLVKFALHYDKIGTMGIEAWYRSKHLTRSEIESVRDYLPEIGASRWLQDNQQALTGWGAEQLLKWRQGIFTDIIELSRTSPTPETAQRS